MANEYDLTKDPFDSFRIKKTIKVLMVEAKADRVMAKEAYDFFKDRVNANSDDDQSKELMIEALKLMQTSKTSSVKCVDILSKLEIAMGKGKPGEYGFMGD